MPAPRAVRRRPFIRLTAPLAWSTLVLTIRADGSSSGELLGASPFPRHWVYDHTGALIAKTGLIDFRTWYRQAHHRHTPWGGEDSPAVVSAVESTLERRLSRLIIGARPPFRRLRRDDVLVQQGEPGDEVFLLFDGIHRSGYELFRRVGNRDYLTMVAAELGEVLWLLGRHEEARQFVEESEATALPDDVAVQIAWRTVKAQMLAVQGAAAEALRLGREAVRLAAQSDMIETHAGALIGLAEVLRRAGRLTDAVPLVEEARRLYERKGSSVLDQRAQAALAVLAAGGGEAPLQLSGRS